MSMWKPDWYDNEHVPLRLAVKGFRSAFRYEAADDREPRWLAMYDVDSPDVLVSDAYKALAPNASERERGVLSKLEVLNRRVYSLIATHGNSGLKDSELSSKYVVFATIGVTPGDEEEFGEFFAEEHIPLLSKIPGWIQSKRYKLISAIELAPGQTGDDPAPGIFLNVHYFDQPWDASLPEAKAISSSPRALEMSKKVTARSFRQFMLYKDLGKPTWN